MTEFHKQTARVLFRFAGRGALMALFLAVCAFTVIGQ